MRKQYKLMGHNICDPTHPEHHISKSVKGLNMARTHTLHTDLIRLCNIPPCHACLLDNSLAYYCTAKFISLIVYCFNCTQGCILFECGDILHSIAMTNLATFVTLRNHAYSFTRCVVIGSVVCSNL